MENIKQTPRQLKTYVKAKIKMLSEFGINLTDAQIEHMYSLENDIRVDNYAIQIMMDCL